MNQNGSDFTSTYMPSITNFGIRPTLDGQKTLLETHILNYEDYFNNNEIYDQRIHVEVLDFLRDEKKFNSFEELKDQILKDVKKAKLFHENK
jgi:riboflavin kinase/FMN adenylyltransferase